VDVVRALALAAALVAVAVSATAVPAAGTQSVSLSVTRTFDPPTRSYKLRFAGAISSGAAGEDVTVMQQTCGYSFATAVAGTQTRAGGAWDAEPASPAVVAQSATYHARWRNVRSAPVVIRPQIQVFLVPVGKGKLHVRVSVWGAYQDMRGRAVLIERLRNKRWTVVRRQQFGLDRDGFAGSYLAVFTVPKGWTVRARVPAKSAAPCFKPNATEKARSA
jgi:hypothetical protein